MQRIAVRQLHNVVGTAFEAAVCEYEVGDRQKELVMEEEGKEPIEDTGADDASPPQAFGLPSTSSISISTIEVRAVQRAFAVVGSLGIWSEREVKLASCQHTFRMVR
jgi:hypothetical protein